MAKDYVSSQRKSMISVAVSDMGLLILSRLKQEPRGGKSSTVHELPTVDGQIKRKSVLIKAGSEVLVLPYSFKSHDLRDKTSQRLEKVEVWDPGFETLIRALSSLLDHLDYNQPMEHCGLI